MRIRSILMSPLLLSLVFLLSIFMGSFKVEAASVSNDLFGAAYSNNIGPVSFNNCASSDPASCSGQSYKVTTFWDSSNPNWTYLTGYAWSDSIGWIAFSNSYVSTSGCPPIPNWYSCQIAYNTNTGVISGWGRAVSYGDGWDGWINFSGVTVGSAGPSGIRALSGNAWGSDIVGSLNMSGVSIKEIPPTSSVTLVASPNQVGPDGSGASNQTTLIWSGQNVTSCTASASSSRGDWTGAVSTNGTKVVQVGPSVTYSIDCINNVTNQVASASAPVTTGVAPSDDLSVFFLSSPKTLDISKVDTWSNTITGLLSTHSGASNVSLFIDPNSGGPNPSEIADLSNYNIKVYSSSNVSGQCSGNVIFNSTAPHSFSMTASGMYCVEVKSKLPVLPPTGPYGSYYNLFLVATSQNVTTPVNTTFGGNGFQVKVTNNTPTLTFVASTTPSSGLPYTGGPVSLNWDSTNTTDCSASTNWSTWAGSPTWAGAGRAPNKLGGVNGTASGNITNTETFTISCNYIGSPTPITASVVVTVPPDPALPTVSLTASQTKFTGSIGKPTLSWTSTKAVSCGPESWTKKTSTSGSEVVTVNTSTTFNLTCYNSSNGSTTDTVKITVIPGQLPEIYMSASPDTLGTGGGTTVISWDSRPYGTSCGSPTIGGSVSSPAWTTKTSAYGSQSVSLTTGSTYGISCFNSFGTTISSITIPVANTPPAPAVLMQATLINGNNYKISWSSTDTTYCGNPTVSPASSNPWTTKDTVDGFENLSISVNTSFGITCYNSNGDSATDNVSVTPAPPILPNITMSAKPHSLGTGGGTTVISWDSRPYGTSCGSPTIGGSVSSPAWTTKTSAYGSQSVSLTTGSTYGISCTNSFGTTISSITIPVDNTPLPPSVSMQKTLIGGNNYKISWSSTDTTSCGNPTSTPILFGANSPNPWTSQNVTTGFENLTIETNTSFGITCYNSNNDSATDSVSVTPNPVTPEISMSISPAILPAGGGNFTVSWTSANTVSCHAVTPVDWTTKTSTSGSESMTIGDNPGTYDIVISCSNAIGVLATASSRISVPERPKLSATISATPVVGGMTDITWKSDGTNSCSATWTKSRATKGTQVNVPVRGSTEFGITCFNGEKSVTASTIVVVNGGEVTVTLSAMPPAFAGGEATLVWESTDTGPGPVSCHQDNSKENINWSSWAGATTAGSGYAKGDVAKTDTFSITCKDVNSPDSKASTAFASISVVKSNPISASLFASPSALSSPGNVDLSWSSTGSVSCTPSWSSSNYATSGTETVAVNNKTQFTVVCTDGKSSFATASATVSVGGSSSGITFNTNIYANPNVLYEVGTTKITWSSGSNATSCIKDWMDPSNTSTNGTDTLNVSSTKLFTVTCSDGSGNEEKSSVSVVVKTPSKLRVSISATPSSSFGSRSVVGSGAGPVTLDWSSISATDCTPSWNSTKKGDLNGSESIWLSETTTFVIDCTDGNQSASASVVVNIVDTDRPLMNSSIFANPPSLPSAGGIVKLIWNSIGLSDCSQRSSSNSGGRDWTDWLGADPSTSGSAKKFLSWSDLFSITCTGPEYSATTGFVVSPSSNFDLHVSLSTDKTVFDTNGKAILSWDSNADNCTPSWNSSKNGKKDSELVNITGTETFTVVCHTNKAEASSTITVFMVDPDGSYVNLSATPSTLFGKGKSKIVWSGSNNLKCVKDWMDPADTTSDGFDIVDIVQQKTFKISCTAIGSIVPIKRSVTVGYREDGGGGCKGWCPISTGSAIHKSKYKER